MGLRYGEPDGFGRYATLDHDEGGKVVCHECGKTFHQLATHVKQAHGIQPEDYRQAHGLGARTRLVSRSYSDTMRGAWKKNEGIHLQALESSRDPQQAKEAGMRRTQWAPETRARRSLEQQARAGRDLTADEVRGLGDPLDIPQWVPRARALLAGGEITQLALARATGLTSGTVSQRLRRYPPKP